MHHKSREMYTNDYHLLDPQDEKVFLCPIHYGCSFSIVETVSVPQWIFLLHLVLREITDCLGNNGISCNSISLSETLATGSTVTHTPLYKIL